MFKNCWTMMEMMNVYTVERSLYLHRCFVTGSFVCHALFSYDHCLWFQKDEIKSCEERVKRLLENIPPKGKEFLHSIEHILEREKNWVSLPWISPLNLSMSWFLVNFKSIFNLPLLLRYGGNVMAALHLKSKCQRESWAKIEQGNGMYSCSILVFYCCL